MQAKEIDILKTEINLYKRKGGHIYTKVTTNRRVAHLNNDNWKTGVWGLVLAGLLIYFNQIIK
jgi:hypothetical protein